MMTNSDTERNKKAQILVFAGTTEGRKVCEFLDRNHVPAIACTATEYGGFLLNEEHFSEIRVLPGRLDERGMEDLIHQEKISIVIDATHPYARDVSRNIDASCRKVGVPCIRLVRKDSDHQTGNPESGCVVEAGSVAGAVDYLMDRQGKILAVTGSKELKEYTRIPNYKERVSARILSTAEAAAQADRLGFRGKNLFCMQGPFSEEMNEAMIRMTGASYLVTKDSGAVGGFFEKEEAARKTGITLVVIRRPQEEISGRETSCMEEDAEGQTSGAEGYFRIVLSEPETYLWLKDHLKMTVEREITLAGIGMGQSFGMTGEVIDSIRKADFLAGARRMIEAGRKIADKPYLVEYQPGKIREYLEEHPQYYRIVILLSGDSGFYSGAAGMKKAFPGNPVRILPGVSSVSYLAAKLEISWEDSKILSIHGRNANVIAAVRENRKVFLLMEGLDSLNGLSRKLKAYGLGRVKISAGIDLSYPDERILAASAEDIPELVRTITEGRSEYPDQARLCMGSEPKTSPGKKLVTALIQNDAPESCVSAGLPDDAFERGSAGGKIVPMTKSEVRAVILSKLRLCRDSIVYDVGAGTGSVSAECARICTDGEVIAIEKKPGAAELIRKNAVRLQTENIITVTGTAPEAFDQVLSSDSEGKETGLPIPTHAFLGGTSGNMYEILKKLLEKNPKIRIVITAVALETLSAAKESLEKLPFENPEIVSLTVARAEKAGPYSMMKGQNPVYILSADGCGAG